MPPAMPTGYSAEPIPLLGDTATMAEEKGGPELTTKIEQFTIAKPEEKNSTDWRSIYIAGLLALCSAIQASLYYSSLWPYLQVVGNLYIGANDCGCYSGCSTMYN